MAPRKINDAQLLDALIDVFRTHGFEGASIKRISEATGLQRASLYHRFPDGKASMAEACLERVDRRFAERTLTPLRGSGRPAERVRGMADELLAFYGSGDQGCLLETLSLGEFGPADHLAASYDFWKQELEKVAREAGFSKGEARTRAEEALVRIQGGLVCRRITGDDGVFRRQLEQLPRLLTHVD